MGLLDKVKNATGLGLNPAESYHRAYEKGVLLAKYSEASEMFGKAAEKFQEAAQSEGVHRARANEYLYRLVATKDLSGIDSILPHLQNLQNIEELGSESVTVSASELATELEARRLENAAHESQGDWTKAQGFHAKAAEKFQALLKTKLKTYKHVPAADHNDSVEERYFLNQGYSSYYQGLLVREADPVQAAERLSQAVLAFKRAKDEALRGRMDQNLSQLRIKRTCWLCHREMLGQGLNVDYYPARITPWGRDLVAKLGQDVTSVEDGSVAVCLSCASMIQIQADVFAERRVNALRQEMLPRINEIISAVHVLTERIAKLERVAHHH
jgi:hypothetical protein